MAMMSPDGGDEDAQRKMVEMFGPGQIDQTLRQALQFCWLSLPAERRNVDEWEQQARRLFERAVRDFREDNDAFRRAT